MQQQNSCGLLIVLWVLFLDRSKMKKMIYGANKRIHAIKFQSVVAPDGQIAMLDGPYEGRKNDSGILEDSELLISRKNLKLDSGQLEKCISHVPYLEMCIVVFMDVPHLTALKWIPL